MQKLVCSSCPYPVSAALVQLLNVELERHTSDSIILNYRDPGYSATTGGFHPVEIHIEDGVIQYITDFAYYGRGDMAELAKELDFNFIQGDFEQMGAVHPASAGGELFSLWQANFLAYVEMKVFTLTVELLD
ncbi:MAG: DUF2787 family protein [Gammaproteobacteria bacterium]|nr:DUF2787 family protein [Gammaproteobacteria bacterium]MBQ0841316.1 DUF2787 family protein [Gammaproteobacteria bacterium]